MWVIVLLKKIISLSFALLFIFPYSAYAYGYSASSVCVMDMESRKILYESNAYEQRAVASRTKILTTLLVLESKKTQETVTVSREMLESAIGSMLYLKPDDKITLYDLAVGMMLVSGNDAAGCAAVYLSGSIAEFSRLMNERCEKIGMKNTRFVTPSGLDDGNPYSSAYDMALLACTAMENEDFAKIASMQSAQIKINGEKQTVYNHNKLLGIGLESGSEFCGIKTGYTDKAGRCLVSAKKYKGNIIITVTLNCPDDWNAHLFYAEQAEESYNHIRLSNTVALKTAGGKKQSVKCSYSGEYYLIENIEIEEYYYPFVYAPVKKGEKIGEALVYYNKKILERLPIEADEEI